MSSGEVPIEDTLYVLCAHGVEVSRQEQENDDSEKMFILNKDDLVEGRNFGGTVGRQVLHQLSRKFDIPIHHFYHPLDAPKGPNEKIQ